MLETLSVENFGKVVTIIASIITAYKVFSELFSKKKEKLRADYDFAEKFIADGKWKKNHDFLLERGYWGLSGKQLEASTIRYFLSQKNPLGQLINFTNGLRYLEAEKNEEGQVIRIILKTPLSDENKLKWKKCRIRVTYFLFAFISFAPVVFLSSFIQGDLSSLLVLIIWVVSFGILAYLYLLELWALRSAQQIAKTSR